MFADSEKPAKMDTGFIILIFLIGLGTVAMRFSLALKLRLLGALLLLIGSSLDVVAIEATWIGGPAGTWTEPTNWSTGVVPAGSFTNVTIDDDSGASSAVVLGGLASSLTIGDVTIDNGDQLAIESGSSLTPEFVTVDGDLVLQAAASLRPGGFLWIQPNGHLSMTDNPSQTGSLVQGSNNAVLWNQGRISGAGAIGSGLPMFNEGFIVGDLPGEILSALIYNNSNSNIGEMLATDGGALLIRPSGSSATLYNSESGDDGLIQARGAGSLIRIENLTVVGGEISTAADEANVHGTVSITNATLRDVRLEGNINARQMVLQGTIENNTTVNYGLGIGAPIIHVSSSAVLSGTGRIELDRFGIDGSGFTSTLNEPILINDANHTIAGGGAIRTERFHFKNRGTVEAYPAPGASELILSLGTTQTAVNSGIMKAINQGTLGFSGNGQNIVIENYEGDDDGVIEADVNSTVRFYNSGITVRGGVLRSMAPTEPGPNMQAGKILSFLSSPVTLRDVRLEGTIGDEFSGWKITGEIENTDLFRGREILVENEVVLSGGGRLQLGDGLSGTFMRGGTNPVQFVNEDNTITGTGLIDTFGYTFINRGTILAETYPPQFAIQGNPTTPGNGLYNSGLLKATNGATLSLQTLVTNFEGSNKGTVHADDASFVRVLNVNGGVFSTSGSGEIVTGLISSTSFLRDVHNQGFLRISGNTDAAGTIENDGTIVNDTNDAVRFTGSLARLNGTGTYGPLSAPMNISVGQLSPTMFIHGTDHTIRGRGAISVINGGFINQGTVIAEGNGSLNITIEGRAIIRQEGTLSARPGAELRINTASHRFINEGLIDAGGYMAITRTLTGDGLEFVNAPNATVRGDSIFAIQAEDDEAVRFWNQEGATVSGALSINLNSTNSNQVRQFLNSGLISPNKPDVSHSIIFINADFTQDSTGVLDFDLTANASTGWYDRLGVADDVQLGGTLKMSLAEGFTPKVGDEFMLLFSQSGTIFGSFESFVPTPMSGRWMSLEYLSDKVMLHINAITADFNHDGFVDADDLDDWQLASQGGTAAGDADGDGDSDGRDFLTWQRQFGAGIDPLATSVAVPEPSGAMLLLAGVMTFALRRQGAI
jgi:hypothetical protein